MQEWDGDAAVRALCLVPSPAGRLLWIGREAATIPVYSVSGLVEKFDTEPSSDFSAK